MKSLLEICCKETPFKFNGKTYLFKDGVAMGTPLGPTFADFYMSKLENEIMEENNSYNPKFYIRYVDDTLTLFKDTKDLDQFIEKLQEKSVLKFTKETPENNNFNFLDIKIIIKDNGKIETDVYVKDTDRGIYLNYNSYCSEKYKLSIIKTLIHRAYKLCSKWVTFTLEVERIKQNLINSSYPQRIVEDTIKNVINNLINKENNKPKKEKITFYYETKNIYKIKEEEKSLKAIIKQHLKPIDNNTDIDINTYYRPKKLSSQFTTRKNTDISHVVYQFFCSERDCKSRYIGYTTNTLKTRAQQHKYKPSKIHTHLNTDHNINGIGDISNNFKILYRSNDFGDLRIAEALLIRQYLPEINIKYNEISNILNIV